MTAIAAAAQQRQFNALWHKAIAALARREHSAVELRQKYAKMHDQETLDALIQALQKDGLQSDARFAQMLCRSRCNKGIGPVRVAHELAQHQIDAELVEQAMAEYAEHWPVQLQALHDRKFGSAPPEDYKAWAKRARFLQQRGYSSEMIRQVIPS